MKNRKNNEKSKKTWLCLIVAQLTFFCPKTSNPIPDWRGFWGVTETQTNPEAVERAGGQPLSESGATPQRHAGKRSENINQ